MAGRSRSCPTPIERHPVQVGMTLLARSALPASGLGPRCPIHRGRQASLSSALRGPPTAAVIATASVVLAGSRRLSRSAGLPVAAVPMPQPLLSGVGRLDDQQPALFMTSAANRLLNKYQLESAGEP
jgi:hypothetical protein